MAQAKTAIGEILSYVHRNPGNTNIPAELEQRVELLVDASKTATLMHGCEKAAHMLLDDYLALRMAFLAHANVLDELFSNGLDEVIEAQLDSRPSFPDLETAYIEAISIMNAVNSSRTNKIDHGHLNVAEPDVSEMIAEKNKIKTPFPTFSDYTTLLKTLPYPHHEIISEYVKSSLQVDYCLIVSALIFDNELSISEDERRQLVQLMSDKAELHAAYAYLLQYWQANEDTEKQWERNVIIVSRSLRSEYFPESTKSVSLSEIEEILTR